MKERGILFSGPMVRAILDGRKTQTRRTVRRALFSLPGFDCCPHEGWMSWEDPNTGDRHEITSPYGEPGDQLWVRETYGLHRHGDYTDWHEESVRGATRDLLAEWAIAYRADAESDGAHWRPSIFMPRWASRITLQILSVRAAKLNAINQGDARSEGCASVEEYAKLWERINGAGSWAQNPWVWVVTFRRAE